MWRHIAFFAGLYFIQGAALAYVITFQKPFLASAGVSKETLGLFTSLLLLPFIAKVFLGMLSDRVPLGRWGGRKPYMVIGLGLFAGCYFALSGVSPAGDGFMSFALLTWFASLGLALFDTCADGWAVDVARPSEQSAIQAAMIAGKSLGLILMSFAFGLLAERQGFGVIFRTLALMSLVVLAAVLLIPYRPRAAAPKEALVTDWSGLSQPFYLVFAAFGIVYSIASFGTDGLVTLAWVEVRHADSYVIGLFGMARGLGALAGAGLYVLANARLGLRRSQYLALAFLGLGCLLPLTGWPVGLSGVLWGLAWGFQETAFVTLAMRFAEGAWAATFFAISMIFSNVGTSLGEALAAPLVPRLGYSGVFTAFAVVAWLCVLFVPAMLRPLLPEREPVLRQGGA
jgi:PAT family beta-lactamase induction signal transducer AmpG